MHVVWLTDIHLNFAVPPRQRDFLNSLRESSPDAILLTGDIAESDDVSDYLTTLAETVPCPIYFVLGNHDFYFGSIAGVRARVGQLCQRWSNLHYLSQLGVLELTPTIGLIGQDGWADARVGDYERSTVMMNDYRLIAELSHVGKRERWPLLKQLGDDAAAHIRRYLPEALIRYQHVYLATHVPPLREACWHEGAISDDEWAPHFVCQAIGDAIMEIMPHWPTHLLTVLCGHTHGVGECRPLPNVHILTGGAEYGAPAITRVIDLPGFGSKADPSP